jgi:hypothetical protein
VIANRFGLNWPTFLRLLEALPFSVSLTRIQLNYLLYPSTVHATNGYTRCVIICQMLGSAIRCVAAKGAKS